MKAKVASQTSDKTNWRRKIIRNKEENYILMHLIIQKL
jgi:hypothetical protein